ncbi:MAG: hypothetical protein OXH92_15785 [Bryobacterales bacterium]|nr:hypothetical protein [Bryobacterales bacterium]MDE0296716.1 hypothetical protein [Bryobacterales bacterium]MDE0435467.1 hypothetical protein [Bryobacterales bacterium]
MVISSRGDHAAEPQYPKDSGRNPDGLPPRLLKHERQDSGKRDSLHVTTPGGRSRKKAVIRVS